MSLSSAIARKHATLSQKFPAIIGKAPFPFFGSVCRATNFVEHNVKAIPRFLGWGISAPLILSFVAFPAVVHNLDDEYRPSWLPNSPPTAASSAPTPRAEVLEALAAEEPADDSPALVAGVDFSPSAAIQTYPTRPGVKAKYAPAEEGDGEEGEEYDEMPDRPGAKVVREGHGVATEKAAKASLTAESGQASVDALRRFQTKPGAVYAYDDSHVDLIPCTPGKKNPWDEDDEDEDDEDDEDGDEEEDNDDADDDDEE
uniref:Uncharacterized protein n=1 Tax=Corethron hystrix TaxID=216773 RepID=A0A7S1BCV4_9STRA|mmetsp:Transcript_21951/g.50032  ORF Transcript_21951/g.50032 Transcript_21951/m.50032 type:complete len:257 (+) Transcript_21951:48-818(+)|eukprot:CAMPEP_0113309566 /NCGR_PEP_ID=MMETSP0010_2-20120614/7556_1 /TAXON_ID=216773 ORGANISM="Corethron hystrix, Strain 308" /NCGR_SAMPLE_ID=MMETSP0010_2 /ASSEMBLY_ACC=CAM_ASM_000155 /LENGTH=256 /DNA_ID=CAMNT_0000164839 /DNA_START=27 /DNA_END=797 /DNA_ORIENTATION=+ /assembly_acc=CAM_ASM_000155